MYLIDTNILIYHFNKTIPGDSRLKLRRIFQDHFNISVITEMEFLGFKKHTEESFEKAKKFIGYADIMDIDEEIVDTVISMRRHKNIKLPDAIIAATAKTNKWTLVTRNEKDFRNIDVEIFNPFSAEDA